MFRNRKFAALLILMVAGAALIIYLFAKEDVQNLGEDITGGTVNIPVEGEPTQETLLESLFSNAIDFDGQMAKLRTEGFENEFFIAKINKVDAVKKSFTLGMEFPVNGGSETAEKIVVSTCPTASTTVMAQENMEVLAENEDIFKWAKKEDLLVSYCLNAVCGSIGRECVLIKTGEVQ